MLKRFLFAFFAFIGLIVPAAFALALLAAPPASPAPLHLPGCDRNLADAGMATKASAPNIHNARRIRARISEALPRECSSGCFVDCAMFSANRLSIG